MKTALYFLLCLVLFAAPVAPSENAGRCANTDDGECVAAYDENNGNTPSANIQTSPPNEFVLVTGADGYIGSSLVKELLERGYRVRGAVRDPIDFAKTAALKSFPHASTHLELVALNLQDDVQIYKTVLQQGDDVDWIMHTAALVDLNNRADEKEQLQMEVNAMLKMLQAAHMTRSVKKFIYTGSAAAVWCGHGEHKGPFSEQDWTKLEGPNVSTYAKLKTLSERAAWQYMGLHHPQFSFSAILPTMVYGPVPSINVGSSTMVEATDLGLVNMFSAFVDIRDVVKAHIQAAILPEAAGKRFILNQSNGGELFFPELVADIRDVINAMGYHVQSLAVPNWLVWLLSLVDSEVASIYDQVDQRKRYDNVQSIKVLQLEYIPANQTLIDGVHSMIEHGLITKTPGYEATHAS